MNQTTQNNNATVTDLYKYNVFPNANYGQPTINRQTVNQSGTTGTLIIHIPIINDLKVDEIIRTFIDNIYISKYTVLQEDIFSPIPIIIDDNKKAKIKLLEIGDKKISYILDSRDVADNLSMPGSLTIVS